MKWGGESEGAGRQESGLPHDAQDIKAVVDDLPFSLFHRAFIKFLRGTYDWKVQFGGLGFRWCRPRGRSHLSSKIRLRDCFIGYPEVHVQLSAVRGDAEATREGIRAIDDSGKAHSDVI